MDLNNNPNKNQAFKKGKTIFWTEDQGAPT